MRVDFFAEPLQETLIVQSATSRGGTAAVPYADLNPLKKLLRLGGETGREMPDPESQNSKEFAKLFLPQPR